jgi:hypothetical protein
MSVFILVFLTIFLLGGYGILYNMRKYYFVNDEKIKFIKDEVDEVRKKVEEILEMREKKNECEENKNSVIQRKPESYIFKE